MKPNHAKFNYGHFSINKEHLESSPVPELELIKDFLQGVEIDKQLKPESLQIYYSEVTSEDIHYYYTDDTKYVKWFHTKLYALDVTFDYQLN